MTQPDNSAKSTLPLSRAPRNGLILMGVILLAMALLALYANVQKARRENIETVTIAPAPAASASVAPSPVGTPP